MTCHGMWIYRVLSGNKIEIEIEILGSISTQDIDPRLLQRCAFL